MSGQKLRGGYFSIADNLQDKIQFAGAVAQMDVHDPCLAGQHAGNPGVCRNTGKFLKRRL